MEETVENAKSRMVRKANSMIQQGRYGLTMQENKAILFLISKINPNDTEFKPFEFSIQEFCAVCGLQVGGGKDYQNLKTMLRSLEAKSLGWLDTPDGDVILLKWIQKPVIKKNSGSVIVSLDTDLQPFLLNLRANFTSYQLGFVLKFKSKYSIRLYELIKSLQYHDDTPYKKVYQWEEIRDLLEANTYNRYCDFNTRVLKSATREINSYSDKNLEIREIKNGRKVERLNLTISAKSGAELDKVREAAGVKPRRQPETPATGKRSSAPRQKKPTKGKGDSGSGSTSGLLDIQRMQSRLGAGTTMPTA